MHLISSWLNSKNRSFKLSYQEKCSSSTVINFQMPNNNHLSIFYESQFLSVVIPLLFLGGMFQFLSVIHLLGHLPVHLWFRVSEVGVSWHHLWLDRVRLFSEIGALSRPPRADPLVGIVGQHVIHKLATGFTEPMEFLLQIVVRLVLQCQLFDQRQRGEPWPN